MAHRGTLEWEGGGTKELPSRGNVLGFVCLAVPRVPSPRVCNKWRSQIRDTGSEKLPVLVCLQPAS